MFVLQNYLFLPPPQKKKKKKRNWKDWSAEKYGQLNLSKSLLHELKRQMSLTWKLKFVWDDQGIL